MSSVFANAGLVNKEERTIKMLDDTKRDYYRDNYNNEDKMAEDGMTRNSAVKNEVPVLNEVPLQEVQALSRQVKFYRRLLDLSLKQRELLEGPQWEDGEIESLMRLIDAREEIIAVLRAEAQMGREGENGKAQAGFFADTDTGAAAGKPAGGLPVFVEAEQQAKSDAKEENDLLQEEESLWELKQELTRLQAALQKQDQEVISLMQERWQEIGSRLREVRERKKAARAYGEAPSGEGGAFLDYRR